MAIHIDARDSNTTSGVHVHTDHFCLLIIFTEESNASSDDYIDWLSLCPIRQSLRNNMRSACQIGLSAASRVNRKWRTEPEVQ